MFLTATNLLCTLFTGSLPRKNAENNFSSRLLASVKLRVNLGSRRHFSAPQLRPSGNSRINCPWLRQQTARAACRAHHSPSHTCENPGVCERSPRQAQVPLLVGTYGTV